MRSLQKTFCECCKTNNQETLRDIFCKQCKHFLYRRLKLDKSQMFHKLNNDTHDKGLYTQNKCLICDDDAYMQQKDITEKKVYLLCKIHYHEWIKTQNDIKTFLKDLHLI